MEEIKEKIIKSLQQKNYDELNIKELEIISNIYIRLKENNNTQKPLSERIKGGK